MKIKVALIMCILLISSEIYSQQYKTDEVIKSEISKLNFLTGEWEGEGWMMSPDGKGHEFNQNENIRFKLDTTLLLIEGVGKSNGITTHNALAVVSYSKKDSNCIFRSYLQNGRGGEFKAELIDHKFYWYPNEKIRYIIWINSKGQWYEKGEYKTEEKWSQFFEMTLDKKN